MCKLRHNYLNPHPVWVLEPVNLIAYSLSVCCAVILKKINNKQSLCSAQVQASLSTQKNVWNSIINNFFSCSRHCFLQSKTVRDRTNICYKSLQGVVEIERCVTLRGKKNVFSWSCDHHVIFQAVKSTLTLCPSLPQFKIETNPATLRNLNFCRGQKLKAFTSFWSSYSLQSRL